MGLIFCFIFFKKWRNKKETWGACFFASFFFRQKKWRARRMVNAWRSPLKQPHELGIPKRNYLVNIIKGLIFFVSFFFLKKMKISPWETSSIKWYVWVVPKRKFIIKFKPKRLNFICSKKSHLKPPCVD